MTSVNVMSRMRRIERAVRVATMRPNKMPWRSAASAGGAVSQRPFWRWPASRGQRRCRASASSEPPPAVSRKQVAKKEQQRRNGQVAVVIIGRHGGDHIAQPGGAGQRQEGGEDDQVTCVT